MKRRLLPQVDGDELMPKSKRQVGKLQAFTEGLLEEVHAFEDLVARLNDEVAILKSEKKRPVFKPSRMNEGAGQVDNTAAACQPAKRPGSQKKSKTAALRIDRERVIEPTDPIPPGSRFKGYRDFIVQDILLTPLNAANWASRSGVT